MKDAPRYSMMMTLLTLLMYIYNDKSNDGNRTHTFFPSVDKFILMAAQKSHHFRQCFHFRLEREEHPELPSSTVETLNVCCKMNKINELVGFLSGIP